MAINTKYNAGIDVAADVAEFKKYTSATVYDVIFIDIVYSQDIFPAIEEFRRQERNSEIPVVFFTTHLKESDFKKSIELDAFDVILKPLSLNRIYSIIDFILYQKGYKQEVRNRRHNARVTEKITLKYNLVGAAENSGQNTRHKANTNNISICGAQFTKGSELLGSDALELELIINNAYGITCIDATGIVKWVKKNPQGNVTVGIEFYNLSESNKEKLVKALYS
jgi:DNA-binding response OmpR family regulator